MNTKPNIVIFNTDSYRGDVLGHLNNPGAKTPNIDALVSEGAVSYSNAFAQNPVCTPSRCSFMTGWYPHVHGHRSMKNMLKEHEPNLFSVLRRENYHVCWSGKNDLFAVSQKDDYLKYCDTKLYPSDKNIHSEYYMPSLDQNDPKYKAFYRGILTRQGSGKPRNDADRNRVSAALDFISSTPDTKPFCLYLALSWPHPPYCVEEDFYNMIDPDSLPPRLPVPERDIPVMNALRKQYDSEALGDESWREIRRIYYAMCAKIDYLFGLVIDALKKKGVFDNTLIIFMADHGDFTGDYSLPEKTHCSLQDVLLRSPFIIKPPARIKTVPGIRTHLTELVDMTATIYDLLEIDPKYTCQGKSLRESLAGNNEEIRTAVFAEVGARKGELQFLNSDVNSMSKDSFYGLQSQATRPAAIAGSYAVSCRTHKYKYIRRAYNQYNELYDIEEDPGELRNLSGFPEYADIERKMETLLLDYFMTTADVLPHEQDSRKI